MILVFILLGVLLFILFIGVGVEVCNVIGWVVFGGLVLVVLFILYFIFVIYFGLVCFIKFCGDELKFLVEELEKV